MPSQAGKRDGGLFDERRHEAGFVAAERPRRIERNQQRSEGLAAITDRQARDRRSGERGGAQPGNATEFMRPGNDARLRVVWHEPAAVGRRPQAMPSVPMMGETPAFPLFEERARRTADGEPEDVE